MLTFYREQKVSPVRQNIADLKRHFERRRSLFIHLGISPLTFRDRSVVEVGPGSGQNALFTASLWPAKYTLVEGNPTGVRDIKDLFKKHAELADAIEIYPMHLAKYLRESGRRHDVVWCENVLGGAAEPAKMLRQLASLVNDGGVLVVTALDEVSTLAESVRRLLAYAVLGGAPRSRDARDAAKQLEPLLTPHLRTLKGMSRLHHDWIVDNICLPLSGGYNILSISDMIKTLGSSFAFHSSSPRFAQDWA